MIDMGGVVLDTVSTVLGCSAKSSRWCRHDVWGVQECVDSCGMVWV